MRDKYDNKVTGETSTVIALDARRVGDGTQTPYVVFLREDKTLIQSQEDFIRENRFIGRW